LINYLIIGGRSYLASEFKRYLNEKEISFHSLNQESSNNYSETNLRDVLRDKKPENIIDFKFPLVSSNDKDFEKINIKTALNPQINLINSLKNIQIQPKKLILVSSEKVKEQNSIYSKLKKDQENLYKKNITQNKKLQIIRLDSVFGPGDESKYRLIPYFFNKIIKQNKIDINIDPNMYGKFIYIEDALNRIHGAFKDLDSNNLIFKTTFIHLIMAFSYILKNIHNFENTVVCNGEVINCTNEIQDEKFFNYLVKTTEWYWDNF